MGHSWLQVELDRGLCIVWAPILKPVQSHLHPDTGLVRKKLLCVTLFQKLPDVESHVDATTTVLVYITDENIE